MNARPEFPTPITDPRDRAFVPHVEALAARAAQLWNEAHEADIARGVVYLTAFPARVGNIIRRTTDERLARMTLADLAMYLARKPTRTLGDRQLAAALLDMRFCAAWQEWREQEAAR